MSPTQLFTRIVVPLDGSEVAARALGHAIALAETFHTTLTLVSVVPSLGETVAATDLLGWPEALCPFDEPAPAATHAMDDRASVAATHAVDYLESVATTLQARRIPCETVLHAGHAAAAIIACAGRDPGTLIVMSTHGRTGLQRWRFGSVAQHVMRHAAVPTLVVRAWGDALPDAHPTVSEITVTLDDSPLAERALPAATALADAFRVPLVLLRVAHDSAPFIPSPAKRYLARLAADLTTPTRAVRAVYHCGVANRPEGVLCAYLADRPAGVVVMASHGRGGVPRWAIGSTAEGMLAHSPHPVLVIRAGTALPAPLAMLPFTDVATFGGQAIMLPGQA